MEMQVILANHWSLFLLWLSFIKQNTLHMITQDMAYLYPKKQLLKVYVQISKP